MNNLTLLLHTPQADAEAMLAFVLADALLSKTGGDSMMEVARNLAGFQAEQRGY